MLLSLVNDVLDISKIEAGKMTIDNTCFDLCELVNDLRLTCAFMLTANDNTLVIDSLPTQSLFILTDRVKLQQIVQNLLSNAIKFTKKGVISLSVAVHQQRVCFKVSDTGIGMTEQQVSRLFQPFTQADGSITRRFGGTGLGLSIAKRLLTLLEGEIQVLSTIGQGYHFYVLSSLPSLYTIVGHNITCDTPFCSG